MIATISLCSTYVCYINTHLSCVVPQHVSGVVKQLNGLLLTGDGLMRDILLIRVTQAHGLILQLQVGGGAGGGGITNMILQFSLDFEHAFVPEL